MSHDNRILIGDCLEHLATLEPGSVQACITSPPYYGLRDYGHDRQIGLEDSPAVYIDRLVQCFGRVRRVLRDDGTLWINLGDSYAGSWGNQGRSDDAPQAKSPVSGKVYPRRTHTGSARRAGVGVKPKDLMGIPWRVALALRSDGWYLRSEIIWQKPDAMPENVADRPGRDHEHVFLLSKKPRYHLDPAPLRRGNGAHGRTVWSVPTEPYADAHFACWPTALVRRMILAGCPPGGVVLDPFFGSGTTGAVAEQEGRRWIGIELNQGYLPLIERRTAQRGLY